MERKKKEKEEKSAMTGRSEDAPSPNHHNLCFRILGTKICRFGFSPLFHCCVSSKALWFRRETS